jgi:predicted TIM-barrel fold metal-dependent hydrolase
MVPRIFGPYKPLRRDYSMQQFLADLDGNGVAASVYVQTNWPPHQAVDEVRWVESVAQATGWPHAIVGFADLLSGKAPETLKALSAFPRMRGIRMQLHWHEHEPYRFAAAPDLMLNPVLRKNLAHLQDYGWSFDLQLFAGQMADGAELAARLPGIPFVLQHAGMLEDTAPANRALWRDGMRRLAEWPNVVAKLSGLGTFIHRNDPLHIADVVGETIEIFGAERCLFGSNFPIEKLWTDYARLLATYREVLSSYPDDAQHAILAATAARIYRLRPPSRLTDQSGAIVPRPTVPTLN